MFRRKSFKCPNCGATLKVRKIENKTIQCDYCDTSFYLPDMFPGEKDKLKTTKIELSDLFKTTSGGTEIKLSNIAQPVKKASIIVLLITIIFPILITGGIIAIISIATRNSTSGGIFSSSSVADIVLEFGEEGTGQGYFTDVRNIAVDGDGNIYVGSYTNNRVQVFDSTGKFLRLWIIEDDINMPKILSDREGFVYVVGSGKIHIFDGNTGEFKGYYQEGSDNYRIDDIAFTPDGNIIAISKGDNLIKFDKNRNVVMFIEGMFENQTAHGELNGHIAVDGMGYIYVMGSFNDAVLKYSPEGKFLNKFGSGGDEPGQFSAMGTITIDNQGRVYVSDIKGIQIFDLDGRYIDFIDVYGYAFGMVINDRNELFIAASDRVTKYRIKI